MKKFLLESLAFLFVISICFFLFWKLICVNREQSLKFPNNENIVFLGNSHVAYAVSDFIVKNSINFARVAETTEFIYCKTKLLKQYNPQLDTIVIGYDNVICFQSADSAFDSSHNSPYFYDVHNIRDINSILKKSSYKHIESYISHPFSWIKLYLIKEAYLKPNVNAKDLRNLGGYAYVDKTILNEIDINKSRNVDLKRGNKSFDTLSIYFLDETIKFCQENGITVIFLCPPQHNKCRLDNTYYKDYYQKKYSNIKFYDFKDMHLPDSCFFDINHLNYSGAKVFSEYLEKEVFHKNNYPQ